MSVEANQVNPVPVCLSRRAKKRFFKVPTYYSTRLRGEQA
jgi:hypothetical protein